MKTEKIIFLQTQFYKICRTFPQIELLLVGRIHHKNKISLSGREKNVQFKTCVPSSDNGLQIIGTRKEDVRLDAYGQKLSTYYIFLCHYFEYWNVSTHGVTIIHRTVLM